MRNPTAGMRCVGLGPMATSPQTDAKHKVVAVDYGAKRNILRCLASAGLRGDGAARDGHSRGRAGA